MRVCGSCSERNFKILLDTFLNGFIGAPSQKLSRLIRGEISEHNLHFTKIIIL